MEAFINLTSSSIHSHKQAFDLATLLRRILEAKDFKSVQNIILLLNDIKKGCKKKSPLQFTVRNIIQKIQVII